MKTTWEIENGALRITVKDGRSEQTWTLRKSHTPQLQAITFGEIAEALGIPLTPKQVTIVTPGRQDASAYGLGLPGALPRDGSAFNANADVEPPERAELRRQAEAARANAEWAHATNDEDTMAAIGSKLPEFKAAGDTTGFSVLPPPSAAIDGTVYDNTQYRKDKSNWVKE